eukprot:3770254-Amphidinium_carterae.2
MRSGCGSFAVPCSRQANATSSLFGDFLALVLLPVGSALSRQTCDAEVVANDSSAEKNRIRPGASWRHEGLQVVDFIVRSGLSAGPRFLQHRMVRAHSIGWSTSPQALKWILTLPHDTLHNDVAH